MTKDLAEKLAEWDEDATVLSEYKGFEPGEVGAAVRFASVRQFVRAALGLVAEEYDINERRRTAFALRQVRFDDLGGGVVVY